MQHIVKLSTLLERELTGRHRFRLISSAIPRLTVLMVRSCFTRCFDRSIHCIVAPFFFQRIDLKWCYNDIVLSSLPGPRTRFHRTIQKLCITAVMLLQDDLHITCFCLFLVLILRTTFILIELTLRRDTTTTWRHARGKCLKLSC